MDGVGGGESFFWAQEYYGEQQQVYAPKRKLRAKKTEFIGWGSKPLIDFLESIGKDIDTTTQISQYDVTDIINNYVNDNNLLHPSKKKRIICDERLHSLFGRKSISRIKIYDMLEPHFAENKDSSDNDDDDDLFNFLEEDNDNNNNNNNVVLAKQPHTHRKKFALETPTPSPSPKTSFASIIPHNIKLVYLKRTLIEDLLLKDPPHTFEAKIVTSFVRIKSDPNDYLQKNSHQLLQVTGVKKASGTDDMSAGILLQVSNFIKDIRISMLSDDNFSEEECEDLRQRVKDGLLKRPTVVELEERAQILHEDITKHWLVGEIALLQKLIDRANEKGWRKELFEHMERRQLLQTPDEQSRLLCEVPKVIADEVEMEATSQDLPDSGKQGNSGSPVSILRGASEIPLCDTAANGTSSTGVSLSTDSSGIQAGLLMSKQSRDMENHDVFIREQQKQQTDIISESNDVTRLVNLEEDKRSQGMIERQVIDLSDDEESEDPVVVNPPFYEDLGSLAWHYADPQGDIQGPFSITSLKRWWDADYFTPDFKVWRMGQSQDEAVLLIDILRTMLTN